MRMGYLVLMALLTAPAGAQEQPLSQEQEEACGSILCLAGGAATPECSPYLQKFFATDPNDRTGFLNHCPDSGISQGALNELAANGQHCEPAKLAAFLNNQLCSQKQQDLGVTCRAESPSAWSMCANYYAELTDEQPPRLVQRCLDARDTTGAIEPICTHRWVTADYETGSWCQDRGADCAETDAGPQKKSLAENAIDQAGNE